MTGGDSHRAAATPERLDMTPTATSFVGRMVSGVVESAVPHAAVGMQTQPSSPLRPGEAPDTAGPPKTGANRPDSVLLFDESGPSGRARTDVSFAPSEADRPGSVIMIDEPTTRPSRKGRPKTVTLLEPPAVQMEATQASLRDHSGRDEDPDPETHIKERLQRELRDIEASHSRREKVGPQYAGKDRAPAEHMPGGSTSAQESASRDGTAVMTGTAEPKSKPSTARLSRSRSKSQPRVRGEKGTLGLLWKEAYRPVVAPTTADAGYRHVLAVHSIVRGGAAEAAGRIKVGDKLIAVQDEGRPQQSRKVVVGLAKDEIRKALEGEAGTAISLELLRATDMGARKSFVVRLVRILKGKDEITTLPKIGKAQGILSMPETPSIKKTGWARGVRLQGDLAPGESNLKEYHSLSEDEQGEDGNRSNSEDDVDYANKQRDLERMKKLKVSDTLTQAEEQKLLLLKEQARLLEQERKRHQEREEYLHNKIRESEDELGKARLLFCQIAERATGNTFDPPVCTHCKHGAVHSLQSCMTEFRPVIEAFLTKIEEAPTVLPNANAERRAQEAEEEQKRKEAARELRDAKAALQAAEERFEKRMAEMASEIEQQQTAYEMEKLELQEKTDEEIAALMNKIELRDKEIVFLKEQCAEMRDELDNIVELKDVEEIKLRLLEAELEGGDSDANQLKKVEILKLACRAAGLNRDALHEALKDAAVRAQIEVLKRNEAELEVEVERLQAMEAQMHGDQKMHRKFKWSVMMNLSKVEPDAVKEEEKRQKAGEVDDHEIADIVQQYVDEAPDEAEIFLRNIHDYVWVRFPFLEITDHHRQIIADKFEDIFKEVPPPTQEELKEMERLRLEDEAVDYGYGRKETTGRTAGQIRRMIAEAKAATKLAKDADRKRREATWDEGSEEEQELVDSEDSDAVYKSDNPHSDDEMGERGQGRKHDDVDDSD